MRITDLDEVQEALSQYRKADSRRQNLGSERGRIPGKIDDVKEDLAEAEATAEVEGRDPEDDEEVQELRAKLKELRTRQQEIEDEIGTADRVVEKFEKRIARAVDTGVKGVRDQAESELTSALEQAISALQNLREARDDLQEVIDEYGPLHQVRLSREISEYDGAMKQGPKALPVQPSKLQSLDNLELGVVEASFTEQLIEIDPDADAVPA